MDVFIPYFKNLTFTRIDEKQGYALYAAMIDSLLQNGSQRYVILFVPAHLAIKTHAKIHELPWQNLQTRTLVNSYRLRKQAWQSKRGLPDFEFEAISRDKNYTVYRGPSNFPFEVLMIHNPKKKTTYQYNNRMMLSSMLENFNSIFNYIGHTSPMDYTSHHSDNFDLNDSFELL